MITEEIRYSTPKPELGAVTLIDVLGWKGIWRDNEAAIETLNSLINETIKHTKIIAQNYSHIQEFRGKEELTKVLSISDTIVLFTSGPSRTTIEMHGKIGQWLIPYALTQNLPLRGAICYGEYSTKDNIMIGYAVDEAASWYEQTDWIGIILTPSAQMTIDNDEITSISEYSKIPIKNGYKNIKYCVDWSFPNKTKLMQIISKKGPHTPDIAKKYLNTLDFLNREQ